MRLKFTFHDALLAIAFAALGFFRDWQATILCAAVLAYVVIQYWRNPLGDNGFLVRKDEFGTTTAEFDVGLDRRKLLNHFRTDCLFTEKNSDIGEPEHFDVRDGVVLEMDMRKRAERDRTEIGRSLAEDRIASLKKEVEWQKMTSTSWNGLNYLYLVTEECVGSCGSYDDEIFSGKLFRVYTKSHFLEHLARDTGGHTGEVLDYKVTWLNHLVDIAAYDPPEVKQVGSVSSARIQ